MDGSLILRVLVVISLPGIPLAWFLWKSRKMSIAEGWPATDAMVESTEIEVVAAGRSGTVSLPVCAFSYVVGGQYYSGRFSLTPNIGSAESLVARMEGKTIRIKVNPKKPSVFYIPDAQIEGGDVHQRYGSTFNNLVP